MRRRLVSALAGLCLAISGGFIASGSASASEVDQSSTPGLVQVETASGAEAGWVSLEFIEQNPDQVPEVVKTELAARDAFGCNREVCIDLQGESTIISRWATTAQGNAGCINAYFQYPSGNYVGPTLCPDGPGEGIYFDQTGPTGYFPHNSQLCNTWDNMGGRPCKFVLE